MSVYRCWVAAAGLLVGGNYGCQFAAGMPGGAQEHATGDSVGAGGNTLPNTGPDREPSAEPSAEPGAGQAISQDTVQDAGSDAKQEGSVESSSQSGGNSGSTGGSESQVEGGGSQETDIDGAASDDALSGDETEASADEAAVEQEGLDDRSNGASAEEGELAWWQPDTTEVSWQWQLTGFVDLTFDVAMYDVDLFDVRPRVIARLQAAGRTVICYLSAGSYESWRADAAAFPAAVVGNVLADYGDEHWLDVRSQAVRDIMLTRLDLAVAKGCDGVEPDNLDGYLVASGFPLTEDILTEYIRFLAQEAHQRGLSIGLKNAVELVDALVSEVDWALNEECVQYNECDMLQPFLDAGKPVFHVEYVDEEGELQSKAEHICAKPVVAGFNTLIKLWDLGPEAVACVP